MASQEIPAINFSPHNHEVCGSRRPLTRHLKIATEVEPLYLAHGQVEVGRDDVHYTVAATETCDPSHVTVLVNGLGGFKSSSRGWRNANARLGHEATISFSPVRNDGFVNNILDPQRAQVQAIEAILGDAKANQQIKDSLPHGDRIDFERVHLHGQSMGGLVVARCAESRPSQVEAAAFIVAAGLDKTSALGHLAHVGVNLLSTAEDFTRLARSPHIGSSLAKTAANITRHHRRPDRTIGEVLSCLFEDHRERVAKLTSLTLYLAAENDSLVPDNESIRDIVTIYKKADITHLSPQREPEKVIAELLSMEKSVGLK